MAVLSNTSLNVLERTNFIACLCTSNKNGVPSGRWVKVVPSDDLSKLYVGHRRLNRAEHDLEENPQAMFVIIDQFIDPLKAEAFQIICTLENKRILSEDDPIYKKVSENTKDELVRPELSFITNLLNDAKEDNGKQILKHYLNLAKKLETNLLKDILVFDIQNIYKTSLTKKIEVA